MTNATDLATRWNLRRVAGREEWRGNCPACKYPDAFVMALRNGRPLLWCHSCGDNRDAMVALLRGSGGGGGSRPRQAYVRQRDLAAEATRKARILGLWHVSIPCPDTPAATYLASRGLAGLETSVALRFHANCPHPNRGKLPALVALVTDEAGNPLAIHRTYLRQDGTGKANADPQRASWGANAGGAIRLAPAGPELIIGEGIETSASAGRLLGLPAWSAICAGNLAHGLMLPQEVRSVVIAADHDPPGLRGANTAAARWQNEGRRVRIIVPDRAGEDFNDVLRNPHHGR